MRSERESPVEVACHQAAMLGWMQELAPYGIFTTDSELKIQTWNEWLESHSGLAAPYVVGRPLLQVFPDLRARKLDEHFRRALSGEVIVLSSAFHNFLLPFPSTVREGGITQMQQTARIAPLSLDGRACGTITIIEDVSQREVQSAMLARQHERDQLLSSALAHLLRTRDPENLVRELFPSIADHLNVDTFINYLMEADGKQLRLHASEGLSEEQTRGIACLVMGESLSGLVAFERSPIVVNHLQTSADAQFAREKRLGLKAIACHPLLVGNRLVGTLAFGSRKQAAFRPEDIELLGTVSQYIAVALDRVITDSALQKAQRELSEHAQELETKVRERTAKLQDTVVQLEGFSYTVAHDLRAPIRALKSYAQLLLELATPDLPGDWRLYLGRIERAANRLEALTRDLLQFSTIARQEVRLSPVDLSEVLNDVLLMRPNLNEEVLIVERPLHPVQAHRTLLQHCLSNLLDNAVKFVRNGIKPRIVVRSQLVEAKARMLRKLPQTLNVPSMSEISEGLLGEPPGGASNGRQRVRIWVEDNGIGIAPESHDKIFGIFERLNAPDVYEGTGIGLAIVARAVHRMGGTCGVESAVGEGSRFWLELLPAESANGEEHRLE